MRGGDGGHASSAEGEHGGGGGGAGGMIVLLYDQGTLTGILDVEGGIGGDPAGNVTKAAFGGVGSDGLTFVREL